MKYIALTMFPTHFQLKKSTVPKKMHKIVHQTPWNWTSVSAIYFAPSTVKVSASPALCSHPDSATEKTGFRIVIQYRTATPAHHIPAIASTSGLTSANWIQVVPKATSPTTPHIEASLPPPPFSLLNYPPVTHNITNTSTPPKPPLPPL